MIRHTITISIESEPLTEEARVGPDRTRPGPDRADFISGVVEVLRRHLEETYTKDSDYSLVDIREERYVHRSILDILALPKVD